MIESMKTSLNMDEILNSIMDEMKKLIKAIIEEHTKEEKNLHLESDKVEKK